MVNKPGSCVGLMTASCWGQRVCPQAPNQTRLYFPVLLPQSFGAGTEMPSPLGAARRPRSQQLKCQVGDGAVLSPDPCSAWNVLRVL